MLKRSLLYGTGLMLLAAAACMAQSAPPSPFAGLTRFSGTVTSVKGSRFVIKSQDGGSVTLTLPAKLNIMSSRSGTLADLGTGKFVGCTAVQRADGKLHATECHIFPESMRGAGEGHNPMGPPNTTMTNGNVATMTNGSVAAKMQGSVQAAGGSVPGAVLEITYKGGEQLIEVSPATQITEITAGSPAMVRPGVKVAGAARPAADGSARVQFLSITP